MRNVLEALLLSWISDIFTRQKVEQPTVRSPVVPGTKFSVAGSIPTAPDV
jgi:hypothetical protein